MKKAIFLLMWLAASYAAAQDEGHVRFLKFQADYQVNADATYTVVRETAYRLLTESALVHSGKMPISYSSKLEEVDILEAYTLKKDGRRIDVGAAGIQTQQGRLAAGYGISRIDQRTMMITFPQLEVGDSIAYKYRLIQKEAVFPNQFYAASVFARGFAWDAIDVSIDMPSSIALQIETEQIHALPVIEQGGRRVHRWYARNLPIIPNEPASIDVFRSTPHLIATTFNNWGQFAAAYEASARPKTAVTPAIAQMADRITQNVTEPLTQARLIYEWITKNVRYVATWVGAEGWVPHDAESVLNNRYGDCKDHVVLMQALLAAKGIASSTVMINSDRTSYSLPSVVYPGFNHVIAYLPAFDLYLDSTAGSTVPFGVLPLANADKPVIHTTAYDGVRRTPMVRPAQFVASRMTKMALSEDGSASIELGITANGVAAIDLRELQRSIGRNKEAEWVREFLDGKNLEGEGNISFEETGDGSSMTMRLDVRVNNFLAIAENGTIPLSPLLVGPIGFDMLSAVYKRSSRSLPYWCPAWTLDDRYEIRVPKNMKLILPKGRAIMESGFSYSSRYGVKDHTVAAARRLSIDRPTLVCQPAEYAAGKSAILRIERDLRAQIIYQATEQTQ
jgi:transglutaminase-like putative cysteine protease